MHEPIKPALAAPEPGKAARQPAAPKELAEFPFDESGQARAVPHTLRLGLEGLEVLEDDAVQRVWAGDFGS